MQEVRYQIQANGQANYVESQSSPTENHFVFTYTVTITNKGVLPVQLLHRYWKITNGDGSIREVHGDGVVGEQPTIVPGDEFSYSSGAILETAIGTMEGHFDMISADGEIFQVPIPVFTLFTPGALH